jgi:hypothetical protein
MIVHAILLLQLPVLIELMLMTKLGRNILRIQQNSSGTPTSMYIGDWRDSLMVFRAMVLNKLKERRRRIKRRGGLK